MVELRSVYKYFPLNGVRALDGANFKLREGEIHALLGENGAGKSTLMHIMAGFLQPGGIEKNSMPGSIADKGNRSNPGTVYVNGKEKHFSSPSHALNAGIGMIRQHPRQIPGFTVWENCITGSEKNPSLFINRSKYRKKVSDLNERLNFNLPLDSTTENLSVSQGQKAAILTLLLRNAQYLILDEPTAVLSPAETGNLFDLLSLLRDEGRGIVLISHKLDEALKIAGRITVLREGKTQITCKPFEISNEELHRFIFGEGSHNLLSKQSIDRSSSIYGRLFSTDKKKPSLSLNNFTVNVAAYPIIRGINLKTEPGKILGIAGVRDSGLETLELAITGFLPFEGMLCISGAELNGGEKSAAKRISEYRHAGGCYLGQKGEGEFLTIHDLLLIHAHRRFHKFGVLNRSKINKWLMAVTEAAKVPHRNNADACTAFSGGQLQRLLLTREMAEDSVLMLLSEPARGLDLRYRKRLASLLREKAEGHTAVVIFSADADELLELTDSVAVLHGGTISKIVDIKNFGNTQKAKKAIQAAMVGKS